MRSKLVVGNWKANGNRSSNQQLLDDLIAQSELGERVECAVCVPYPYLFQAQQALARSKVGWGAQDVSQYGAGAYTGAVTAAMLKDFDCRFVIVGHSERRAIFGDTSEIVAVKFGAALAAGLTPILCVGETLEERELGSTEKVVSAQLGAVLTKAGAGAAAFAKAVIASEPVWAIGTGKTATPDQAQAVHKFIRTMVANESAAIATQLKLLYGGSVKASNAQELFAMPDIDGGLIGGASLVAAEFVAICNAAEQPT